MCNCGNCNCEVSSVGSPSATVPPPYKGPRRLPPGMTRHRRSGLFRDREELSISPIPPSRPVREDEYDHPEEAEHMTVSINIPNWLVAIPVVPILVYVASKVIKVIKE